MPELPEVETVRRSLVDKVTGAMITGVEIIEPKFIRNVESLEFVRRVTGKTIRALGRRGKRLILDLGQDELVIHLMMAGRLLYHRGDDERAKHTHLIFPLEPGGELRYVDLRHFGGVFLRPAGEADNLGPEPLEDAFTQEYFLMALQRKVRIKPLLLDQKLVVGLGNIYADECLFRAGIHPERVANSLSSAEVGRLREAIRDILQDSITHRGTTFSTYVDGEGKRGEYGSRLQVYKKAGGPCPRCGGKIVRMPLGGRTAHFCPSCQS